MNKFISVVLCVLMLFTAVACNSKSEKQSPKTYDELKELYSEIISEYSELLLAKQKGEKIAEPNTDGMSKSEAEIAKMLHTVVDSCKDAEDAELFGYGYKDFDQNGIPELVLLKKSTVIRAVLTISDEEPILLESIHDAKDNFYFASDRRFFIARSVVNDNVTDTTFYTCRVNGDKMAYDAVYGKVYDQEKKETLEQYQIVNSERVAIDDETYWVLSREYQNYTKRVLPTCKLEAPYIYYPLSKSESDKNLPVADFSDYAAIRKTYAAISTCIDDFSENAWLYGEYDNLFSFPNDLSYEYYTMLLYNSYSLKSQIGYDEIDINGDGQDELILLDEQYNIKAIFTLKDKKPVLLGAFGQAICWQDEQGLIHVDNIGYDVLEYSLYEFTKDGEYKHHYSIIVDNFGRYLKKDNKIESLDFDLSLQLYYDEYCKYSEPFEPYEQTRNVTKLTYTPLTKTNADLLKEGCEKTWKKRASLEKTTGKDGAFSITQISLETLSDKQAKVNFDYTFVFYYPDPNDDNYLLDDITESNLSVEGKIENGTLVFDNGLVKGKIEFYNNYIWLIIEESSDERFFVGNHCYEEDSSSGMIS